jgi:hypothetical protein
MGLSTAGNMKSKPFYYQLYENKLVEFLEFTLCFGHNGGKFIVGGYDDSLIASPHESMQWSAMIKSNHFKINLRKYKVGNIVMPSPPKIAFIDSGTTFAYMSQAQKNQIGRAIDKLCSEKSYN